MRRAFSNGQARLTVFFRVFTVTLQLQSLYLLCNRIESDSTSVSKLNTAVRLASQQLLLKLLAGHINTDTRPHAVQKFRAISIQRRRQT